MRKKILSSLIIAASLGVASTSVFAAIDNGSTGGKASESISWTGFVGGGVPGEDIIIRGRDGGEVKPGVLNVNEDGTFTTLSSVYVQANQYDSDNEEVLDELYNGSVNWTVDQGGSVRTSGDALYNPDGLVIKINDTEMGPEDVYTTNVNEHKINVFAEFKDASLITGEVFRNDLVQAHTIIYAEGDTGGIIPTEQF